MSLPIPYGPAMRCKYCMASDGCENFLSSTFTNSPFSKPNFKSLVPVSVTCVGHASSGNMPFDDKVSFPPTLVPVSYTHLRAHETPEHLVCRLLLEKKK